MKPRQPAVLLNSTRIRLDQLTHHNECTNERDHFDSREQTQRGESASRRMEMCCPASRQHDCRTRVKETEMFRSTPRHHDQLQSTSRQHDPGSSNNTAPTTQQRASEKETSPWSVGVKEAILVRYHRHNNHDCRTRVKEMRQFRSTPRHHDHPNQHHDNTTQATQPTERRRRTQFAKTTKPGGRRGKLTTVHGGVLISFETEPRPTTRTHHTRPNTQHDNPSNEHRLNSTHQETITITMVQKNTRPLTSDNRIHELIQELSELQNRHWDFVTISETWREQKEDMWTTRQGHTFAIPGNNKACHGTAILIHKV